MEHPDWYPFEQATSVASPALVFYEDRIRENIRLLLGMIDDKNRLRPHVKTHKSPDLVRLMLEAGINTFKCATIAEAEMLGICGVKDVLLAYQPVGPNQERFLEMVQKYPATGFSCLLDHVQAAKDLSEKSIQSHLKVDVFIDLNVGMNRTGIPVAAASELFREILDLEGLNLLGLHAYDGHIHDSSFEIRRGKATEIILDLQQLKNTIATFYPRSVKIVAGGTPTFPIYAKETDFDCSPGTFALWDQGYQDAFQEQAFLPAAVLLCRVVSLPATGLICVDLGHKAVSAENELPKRVVFLNAPELVPVSQSEEHLVLKTKGDHNYKIGDILYGLPHHICPTVALYEEANCVSEGILKGNWPITSRKRKITI